MKLTPSAAMARTAERGFDLQDRNKDVAELAEIPNIISTKINDGELSPVDVAEINAFFSETTLDRQPGWELTPVGLAYQLHGGDAGKSWAAGQIKSLLADGVSLEEPQEMREFFEMFFDADQLQLSEVAADKDGLIWKPMLVEGIWKIGPQGKPLKVVKGHSKNQLEAIGMADIVKAFNEKAVAHVTIPKTHNDAVDENTGFIDKVKLVKKNGKTVLVGGHRFTDKAFGQMVLDGSVANTSVGLEFGYQRKEDGKTFPVVLRHNAATNRPWLGGKLPAFGLGESAEIDIDNYSLMCGEYVEELQLEEDDHGDGVDDKPTSVPASTISTTSNQDNEPNKESTVADEKKKDETTVTPPVALSENPEFIAWKQAQEEEREAERLATQTQLSELRLKDRTRDANDYIVKIKGDLKLSETDGATAFLKKVHSIALSDEGDTAINLSEGDAAPRSLSAFALVKEVLDLLPGVNTEGTKLKTQLSEQQSDPFGTSASEKPKTNPSDELSLSERYDAADDFLAENMGIPKPATNKES